MRWIKGLKGTDGIACTSLYGIFYTVTIQRIGASQGLATDGTAQEEIVPDGTCQVLGNTYIIYFWR